MFLKIAALTLCAATPFAFVTKQDPEPAAAPGAAQAQAHAVLAHAQAAAQQDARDLESARRELAAARAELQKVAKQLDGALDALEVQFEPQRDRNCSPSRSRALLSHYRFLRDGGHEQRAAATLAKVIQTCGDDANRQNEMAWNLMTDKETTGKYDDVALAIAQRMAASQNLAHNQLDTAALAFSLAGRFGEAVALQKRAIERGGNSDEYRRRLRTYEAAEAQLARSAETAPALLASKE